MPSRDDDWARDLKSLILRSLIPVLIVSAAVNLLILASPLYMLQVYDRVLMSGSYSTLMFVSFMALTAFIGLGYFDLIRAVSLEKIGAWLRRTFSPMIFQAMLQGSAKKGYQGTQSLRDVQVVQQFVGGSAMTAFLDAPFAPLFVILTFMLHWSLGVLTVFGGIVLFAFAVIADRASKRSLEGIRASELDSGMVADGFLRGADFVSSSGMEQVALDRFNSSLNLSQSKQSRVNRIIGIASSSSKAIRLILQSASLGLGAYLVLVPTISFTPGAMIAGSILMARALSPVEQSINAWRYYKSALQALQSLQDLMNEAPIRRTPLLLPMPSGSIKLEGVGYAHRDAVDPLFSDLNAKLQPGSLVGILGDSGSGKTTLCRMLAGIEVPSRGCIRINGTNLENWSSLQRGKFIGYLPQAPIFFGDSIAKNIARLSNDALDAEIHASADEVGAHRLISQLPAGYSTTIGLRGTRLSGGQAQFIGLARANYARPVILVLDEPTAHLDTAGRKSFLQFLDSVVEQERLAIIASHDPEVIKRCQTLIVLQKSGAKVQHNRFSSHVLKSGAIGSGQGSVRIVSRER